MLTSCLSVHRVLIVFQPRTWFERRNMTSCTPSIVIKINYGVQCSQFDSIEGIPKPRIGLMYWVNRQIQNCAVVAHWQLAHKILTSPLTFAICTSLQTNTTFLALFSLRRNRFFSKTLFALIKIEGHGQESKTVILAIVVVLIIVAIYKFNRTYKHIRLFNIPTRSKKY